MKVESNTSIQVRVNGIVINLSKEMEIGEVTTIGIEEKNREIWLGSHITQLIRPVWVSLGKHGEVVYKLRQK